MDYILIQKENLLERTREEYAVSLDEEGEKVEYPEEMSEEESLTTLEALQAAPLWFVPSHTLVEAALRIAASLDRPLGDGLSLALAVQSDCRLVTTNQALYDIVQGTPFSTHVKWVGDLR